MEVAIIHYHLNPGGVTRIIDTQIKGLKASAYNLEITVLCGDDNQNSGQEGVRIISDKAFSYIDAGMDGANYAESTANILTLIKRCFKHKPILHFHNPNLGKNPALTLAVYQLASEGYPVINHCHDFPEDRPANLAFLENVISGISKRSLSQVMYPDFPWYHFIVLNSCDYDRILQQEVPASRLHLLPNPVAMTGYKFEPDKAILRARICQILGFDPAKKICTYPVRAIARKNLGEFLLLAALFDSKAQFAVTQPPKNPVELPGYSRWKSFCIRIGLGIKFEAGESVNHEELINISDFCITTSLREGFGMAYLEPWLTGTPVIGRELTCIVDDLKKLGVEFPRLYNRILVESNGKTADFKDLSQDEQEGIIKDVITQHESRLKLHKNNPFLNAMLDDFPFEVVMRNQQVIKKRFSIEEYGKKLFAIYKEISR